MRSLRKQFEIKPGVKVDTLFTPHLYSFKGTQGVTFDLRDDSVTAMLESYADLIFCAALNAWILDGKGTTENFPYTRGDFHEWMVEDTKGFGDAVNFAVEALTGKSAKELAESKMKETKEDANSNKKKVFSWIGRLLKRS